MCFFFKQKTAYEMRISDWSSDVCSSDLEIRIFTDMHLGIRLPSSIWMACRRARRRRGTFVLVLAGIQRKRDERHAILDAAERGRSEERRVGTECVSTCRSRW